MSYDAQFRGYQPAADWTAQNPVLEQFTIGVESDTGRAKLGDGATTWNNLTYWNPLSGSVRELFVILTQSGTSVPTASVWSNTTGTTWTPARSNSGQYTLTPADTSCLATPSKVFVIAGGGYGATYSECVYVSTSEIQFNTYNELGNPLDYDGTLWLALRIKP